MAEAAVAPLGDGAGDAADCGLGKGRRLAVFGLPLHRLAPTPRGQLAALGALVLLSSGLFAAIQERVLYVPGFKYTGWISTLTSLVYAACALLDRGRSAGGRLGSLAEYAKLSVLTMGGMYLTNWSLKYLSYPLRVVFKSSKLIPVMFLGVVYLKKRYTAPQYASVLLLTAGVVLFALGDARGKAVFDPRGLGLILVGSLADALAANFEEKRLFAQLGCPTTEVMLYTGMFGCVWSAAADCAQGDFLPALRHSRDHPEVPLLISAAAVAGYVAMTGILLLIKLFGATAAEVVKSCRKVLTICVSFGVYGKPWTLCHVAGGLLFAASIAVERYSAGGPSRRFALALVFSAALSAGCLLRFAPTPSTYSVIIDAGMTATRVHVFRFDAWTLRVLPVGGAAQAYHVVEPGLGAFAHDVAGVRRVLGPLLDVAAGAVPPAQRAETPFAVRANAGLQELPNREALRLLAAVRDFVRPFGFADAGAELLDGAEEAECAWLTVNFLMGSFRPGVQAVRDPVAVLDLRSVSLQAAHLMRDADAQEAMRSPRRADVRRLALPFGSGNVHIYRHSYLGAGLVAARRRAAQERGHLWPGHPCWLAPTPPSGSAASGSAPIAEAAGAGAGAGSGAPGGCPAFAAGLLRRAPADAAGASDAQAAQPGCGVAALASGRCTFDGAWEGPRAGRRLALVSYFFERLADAGVVSAAAAHAALSPANFTAAAARACEAAAGSAARVQREFPRLPPGRAEWLCFDLTYLAVLLTEGLGLAASREVLVVRALEYGGRTFEASWALGLAIKRLAA